MAERPWRAVALRGSTFGTSEGTGIRGTEGPSLDRLPGAAWIIGLGNLGQAYLWTLGLLPFGSEAPELVLQDIDVLAPSNLSTSLLTFRNMMGRKKTRALADWADARGFKTAIVELPFAANFHVGGREARVALVGVDNALARQAVEDVGFPHCFSRHLPSVVYEAESCARGCVPPRQPWAGRANSPSIFPGRG